MGLSNCLKELRAEKKCTQKELADYLGYSKNIICEWENRRSEPRLEALSKLADFFGVSTDYLLGRSDELGFVTVQSVAPSLSENEEMLLRYFRALTPELQGAALETVRVLAGVPAGNGLQKKA